MWTCKNCNEENEDNFDACWNCGAQTDGKLSKTTNEFEKTKNEIEISTKKSSSAEYTSSYQTTRIIAQIVSFIGWLVVIISAVIFIIVIVQTSRSRYGLSLIGLLPAVYVFIGGLFLIMYGQLTRAIIDNTDNTGEILSILKEIAEKR